MRNGKRHPNAKIHGYGRSKPGRKVDDTPPPGPTCSTCRRMSTAGGVAACSKGHQLEPVGCPDYSDASVQRPILMGGTTGIPAR